MSASMTTARAAAPKSKRGKRGTTTASTGPRNYKSKNFLIHTDMPPEEANELLGRLERMLKLVTGYFGRPNRKTIECYVIQDVKKWPPGSVDPEGLASVLGGGGVTKSSGITNGVQFKMKAIVYAGADRGTPQHESIHAYCAQTFGRTGPTWYSEGMAEVGQYFRDGDDSVQIHPGVLKYLQTTPHKALNDLVNSNELTGDSWQNYAWRWALCHMLGYNPNYSSRFKPLGMALLQKKRNVSFNRVYGPMAPEITFEYDFFLDHLVQGYRVDLCAWDWKTKFKQPQRARASVAKIEAGRGWQASRALVKTGDEYQFAASGTWKIARPPEAADAKPQDQAKEEKADETPQSTTKTTKRRSTLRRGRSKRSTSPQREMDEVDGDGLEDGRGKLVGVIFNDYELSEPFELGVFGTFTAPMDGQLFLRCRDDWGVLAHNTGVLSVRLKPGDSPVPLKDPREDAPAVRPAGK